MMPKLAGKCITKNQIIMSSKNEREIIVECLFSILSDLKQSLGNIKDVIIMEIFIPIKLNCYRIIVGIKFNSDKDKEINYIT